MSPRGLFDDLGNSMKLLLLMVFMVVFCVPTVFATVTMTGRVALSGQARTSTSPGHVGGCVSNCTLCSDESSCLFQGCYWNGFNCEGDFCLSYIDQTTCELNGCFWNGVSCETNPGCAGILDPIACDASPSGCLWCGGICYDIGSAPC